MKIIKMGNALTDFPIEFPNSVYHSKIDVCLPYSYNSKDTVSIKYPVSGCEVYIVDRNRYKVNANHFLVVKEHSEVESFIDLKSGFCEAFSIFLEGNYLNEIHHQLITSDGHLLDDPFRPRAKVDFLEILSVISNNKLSMQLKKLRFLDFNEHPSVQEEIFYDIAKELIISQNLIKQQVENITALKQSTRYELFKKLLEAKAIIEDLNGKINIPFLSREVGLSQFHLMRSFKQAFGITPYRYAMNIRIRMAKQLLRKTDDSVFRIGNVLGFNDVHCFSKTFKKETGIPPSKFRELS